MTRLFVVFVLVAAGLVLGPTTQAHAEHRVCSGYVGPAELGVEGFVVELPGEPVGTYYLDVRYVAEDTMHLYSFWLYQESNGVPDLQRGGSSCKQFCPPPAWLSWSDYCQQSENPDRLIF